jgi:hypothetical protein
VTSLAAYCYEYVPEHIELAIRANHPLYAFAWLGAGELLHQLDHRVSKPDTRWSPMDLAMVVIAAAAVIAFPIIRALTDSGAYLPEGPFAGYLTKGFVTAQGPNVIAWLSRVGLDQIVLAAGLPVLIIVFAVWLLLRPGLEAHHRAALWLALGPVIALLVLSSLQLHWVNLLNISLIAMVAVITGIVSSSEWRPAAKWVWTGCLLTLLAPGFRLIFPNPAARSDAPLSQAEVQSLVERDFAYWLARKSDDQPITAFAPPDLTDALSYYGGIRGIGTLDPENQGGFTGAVRIASASTWAEALELLSGREVTHIIVPSWDSTLDQLVRVGRRVPVGAKLPDNSFVASLNSWRLPNWVKPIPYHIPGGEGFETYALSVLKIVSEQDPALTISRLADYFVELNQHDRAAALQAQLALYPRDLSALVARAQMAMGRGDAAEFARAEEELRPYVSRRSARSLPFDRRVNLAVVLAQAKQSDLAQQQLRQAMQDVTESRLRELGTSGIVRLLALARLYDVKFPDERLHTLALELLPPAVRANVTAP